jgi:hypothetical protein
VDNEKEAFETDAASKTSITEGVSNLVGAAVSSIAESVKAVASTITDRIKATPPDPNKADHPPEPLESGTAHPDEELLLRDDVAIALEAVPHPTSPLEHVATKKSRERATKATRNGVAKRISKRASKGKRRSKPKKSKKQSVNKSGVRVAQKIAKKATKAVEKVAKKKKKKSKR